MDFPLKCKTAELELDGLRPGLIKMTIMSVQQIDEIFKKIQAAKKRYDHAFDGADGVTNPQDIDKITNALTDAHIEILVALEKQKR